MSGRGTAIHHQPAARTDRPTARAHRTSRPPVLATGPTNTPSLTSLLATPPFSGKSDQPMLTCRCTKRLLSLQCGELGWGTA